MRSLSFRTAWAAVMAAGLLLPATIALAADPPGRGALPEKHDSNTLHKVGKAIQYPVRKAGENATDTAHKAGKAAEYPVRKAGENASVTAHEATGKNSVIHRREKNAKRVVTPKGKVYTMHQAKRKGLAH